MTSKEMTFDDRDTYKLIHAIIRWLSEFPKSVISTDCTPEQFLQPIKLYQLLRFLLYEEDFNNINHNEMQLDKLFNEGGETSQFQRVLSNQFDAQIEILRKVLDTHFSTRIDICSDYNRQLAEIVDFKKLILFHDKFEVKRFCQQLVKIGTYTSKLSTFGLTSLEFLIDEDQNLINKIRDQQRTNDSEECPFLPIDKALPFTANSKLLVIDSSKFDSSRSVEEEGYYIQEDEIEAIHWENAVFEKVIYDIAREMNIRPYQNH